MPRAARPPRHGRLRPVSLLLSVVCGAAIAAVAAFLLLPSSPASAPFVIPAAALRPPAELAAAAGSPSLRPIVIRDGQPTLGSGPAGPATDTRRPAAPVRLSIPALGVDARIDAVSATASGIAVPAVGRAGWFAAGPRPGEPGRAVLIGHLDAANGPGLFALLPGVASGTEVAVVDAHGTVHRFRIVGRAEVEKAKFPTDAVYGASDRPVLVMVTCGGPYTPGAGYRDNVLVYARAV